MTTETNHARQQAEAQLQHIQDLIEWLDHANECNYVDCDKRFAAAIDYNRQIGSDHDANMAEQAIDEMPLSVEVRSGWYNPNDPSDKDRMGVWEYRILLSTGGPATRIIGELNEYGEPETARLEYQDWFTPWEPYASHDMIAETTLIRFAQQFYFGG